MGLPEMTGWKVLVIGLGMTGRSAAVWCAARGAEVVAADERSMEILPPFDDLLAAGRRITVRTGVPIPDAADFDLVVPSPGVPHARYASGARRIWGDIELAARALAVPVVAVTGTNGKSTTVRLIEAMLRAAGLRARAAGNIGTPALELVGEALDVAVLEVSSFQLEAVEEFRPRVAVILNVTPDHLDRHGSLAGYARAKARILARQEEDDFAVLNFDDPIVRELAGGTRARVVPFSRRRPLDHGVWLDTSRVVISDGGGRRDAGIDALALPGLRGAHNIENVLAATAAVHALGADVARARHALVDFAGLPHRSQQVASGAGVTFVDDSKATNVGAAERSLEGFASAVVWIAGGRGKRTDLSALADTAARHVKHAVLIGEAAGEIETALAGRIPVERCASIEEAVAFAAERAKPRGVVLLAPACASFDQFANFEERGDRFARAARQWVEHEEKQ